MESFSFLVIKTHLENLSSNKQNNLVQNQQDELDICVPSQEQKIEPYNKLDVSVQNQETFFKLSSLESISLIALHESWLRSII